MADPTKFTSRKELVSRDRLVRGEDTDDLTQTPDGIFLELWEGRQGDRTWALSILDDYRAHLGDGIHIPLDDDEAGWLQRHYVVGDDDD